MPTRTACRNLCLRETSFLCRSFAFLAEADQCYLYSITSVQAGTNYARLPGYVFEEWMCTTGQHIMLCVLSYTYLALVD